MFLLNTFSNFYEVAEKKNHKKQYYHNYEWEDIVEVKAISISYRSSITSNCFDIYTFLMCQGERKERPKIFHENIAGNWPDKKTMSTYLIVLSYSSTASIGKGKNPGKRLIWNNLVVLPSVQSAIIFSLDRSVTRSHYPTSTHLE